MNERESSSHSFLLCLSNAITAENSRLCSAVWQISDLNSFTIPLSAVANDADSINYPNTIVANSSVAAIRSDLNTDLRFGSVG